MHQIKRLTEAYHAIDFSVRKAALATVIRVEGSAYRRPGARMLMTDDGRWTGAISGGCLEGDALRKARRVILSGQPEVVTYDTMDDSSATSLGVGLGCNGIIDVFIEPIDAQDKFGHFAILQNFIGKHAPEIVATVVAVSGLTLQVGERYYQSGETVLQLSHSGIQAQLLAQSPVLYMQGRNQLIRLTEGEGFADVFVEILQPPIRLVIFGGGYDVAPVVALAKATGWEVTVTDDCVAHVGPKRFPMADAVCAIPREAAVERLNLNEWSAAVLMSHNYKYDLAILRQLLRSPVRYIGILGPRKRGDKMLAELAPELDMLTAAERQLLEEKLHSPIGLDIGAETPEEIAVSIVAEVMAAFRSRSGQRLKYRNQPIHSYA
jgi:xanthine/CO dehydrogenase XdhC/CoxF family maturation factor